MDVIEDLHAVLRIVLDYVGLDIDDVGDYLAHLNRRQRLAVQEFGHFLAAGWNRNITQRRVFYANRWHHWRSDIRHRSLIRIIGTSLSLKPPKRLKITSHMLRQRRTRLDSLDSESSLYSLTSTCPSTDENLVWVEEELGDNCIRVRAQKKEDLSDSDEDIPDDLSDDIFINRNNEARSPLNSTMISSVSMVSSCDPGAMSKICALEDELSTLRKQIAMLVFTQEHINKSEALPNNSTITKMEEYSTPSTIPVVGETSLVTPEVLPTCLPPVPPPPPLPATPSMANKSNEDTPVRNVTFSEHCNDKENTMTVKQTATKYVKEEPVKPATMTDVLKGIKSVKLRSVQRSPGGTPMKLNRPQTTNHSDPASLIAQALKKKFANHHVYSPDGDKENENNDFSSPDCSPHVFRKTAKRRSLLFEDRRKSSGPLKEVNA